MEDNDHSVTTGTGQGVQPFHSANILVNYYYKIQAVMGTIECDRIKGERGRKAASQGGSWLQGFQTSSGWPSAFLVILGEFEVIHTLSFLFHLPVSFFLFLITVSWKKCSGHPLCLREWHWKFHSLLWRTSELSLKARGSKKGSKHFFPPGKGERDCICI